jgi:alpha-glucosidase (family GH31 glycosyl hydrolase)
MTERLRLGGDPVADPAAIVSGDQWRITVLTEALIRLERSESGEFEDRASTFAVQRKLPVPDFEVRRNGNRVDVITSAVHLEYDGGPFDPSGLIVTVLGLRTPHASVWRYGEPAGGLGGTARTLDEADGAVPLGGGVVAVKGLAVVDDTESFLIEADGTPASRRPGARDLYVFGHGRNYAQAVRDLYAVSGPVPVLPRWALGNWWSKYHPYSAEEYLQLMERFAGEQLPFSVAVIDMDWHPVDIDPRFGAGWTGYSWNRELFPDPPAFLRELHGRGLHVTLNVHPADGVHAHEDRYADVAKAVGIDPATEQAVPFDPTDPTFMEAYFRLLHHPLEEEGVDFWWLDWQQGSHTRIPGVDPLWLLNIEHFNDSGRGGRRPLTFSRYAGPGSHRYPVGFSGDSVISWKSLEFQPYFTATASNIGYSWWSHDIGGHFFGARDDALSTRWAQFGIFTPIMRLHSSLHPFIRKEPWTYPPEERQVINEHLRLRHRLVPYLHTMNARASWDGQPLVRPMYWTHPDAPESFRVPNQYWFGTELVVAPITSPQDDDLLLGSVKAWLPPGRWTDLFTGVGYAGGREVRFHRPLQSIPVLVKAGGILPLAGAPGDLPVAADQIPQRLELVVAPGADGEFELLEDLGAGDGRDPDQWARTLISYDHENRTLTIGAAQGATDCLPPSREWTVTVLGATADTVAVDGSGNSVAVAPAAALPGVSVAVGAVDTATGATVRFDTLPCFGWSEMLSQAYTVLDRAQLSYERKQVAWDAVRASRNAADAAARIQGVELDRALESALLELILADPAAAA